ncbi:hypothetical protein N1851_033696 [Merluccius polli]|uniref:Reverse transcriptase domain-containing protein n=1 Tax=Merluccius polli TaxID=89951 RepID=A0AA47M0Z5_MERPO|nr:hypothetical protein N1851_033696 [Merluccius polli]
MAAERFGVEEERGAKQPYTKNQREAVIRPPEPAEAFHLREPLLKEVQGVVRKARSRSAPGPSGTSYKVYKHCPKLLHRLWRTFKVIWRRGKTSHRHFSAGRWHPWGVVTQLFREAKENWGDLVVLWLDLDNTYGSMPHKLVLETLE